MSAKILQFKIKERPSRLQAIRWLLINNISYPNEKQLFEGIGPCLFHGWRFIKASNNVIYFADCIHEGITEYDLKQFKLYA